MILQKAKIIARVFRAGLIFAFCASWAPEARAFGKGDKGSSGAQFLKLGPSARAAGMGEAFSGVADDAFAAYYNPAGLGLLDKVEVAAMHNSHFQDVSHDFGVLAVPMLSWVDTREERNAYGVLALSLTSLSVDEIERRGTTESDEPVGTFGSKDFAYALGYGVSLSKRLSVGLNAKFIDLNLDSSNATAAAVDAGVLYRSAGASLGAGLRNLGTELEFANGSDPLPLTAFVGAGYRPRPDWLFALDLRLPRDNVVGASLGAEFKRKVMEDLTGSLRAGYNSSNRDAEGLDGISAGAGLTYRNLDFAFAWVPFGDLGNTFRYSLAVKF